MTEGEIKAAFADATEITKQKSQVPDGMKDQNCGYTFKMDNENYVVRLNLLAARSPYVDKTTLESKVKYMKGSELISGVGEVAYYSKQMGVLTALGNNSIVQVSAYSKDSNNADKNQ